MKNAKLKILVFILSFLLLAALVTIAIMFFGNQNQEGEETATETESGTEIVRVTEDFDYLSADLSKYITLSPEEYKNTTVTLSTEYLVDDALVQKYIDDERFKNRQKLNGGELYTDRPIAYCDSAFIYYTGYINGEKFEGGSNAEDEYSYELAIGSGSFIPGFEDALIGVIPSQTSKDNPLVIDLTFPEDYYNEDLAGKDVVFHVWVEYTIQYSIPEFDDAYVHEILKFSGSPDEYRAQVKENLINTSKDTAEEEAVSAIMSKLIEKATIIEYPEQSVEYWYYQYLDQFEYYMQYYSYYYGYTFNSLDEFVSLYMGLEEGKDPGSEIVSLARQVVRNNLIYYTIAKQEGLSVSEEEYKQGVDALVIYYNDYYASSGSSVTYTAESLIAEVGEAQLKQNMLFDKVDDFLIANCTIEYKDAE